MHASTTACLLVLAACAVATAAAVAAATPPLSPPRFVFLILREDCVDTFFGKLDVLNVDCLTATISKCLGFAIIAGSCVVKLPQIYNIVKSGSVAGVSPAATYLELASSIAAAVWHVWNGSPFSAYGESVIVAGGTAVLVLLLWSYLRPGPLHVLAVSTVLAGVAALGAFPPSDAARRVAAALVLVGLGDAAVMPKRLTGKFLMDLLQYSGSSVFAFSRLSQIAAIEVSGTTGQLSVVTLLMNFAGTAARVFTSAQEVKNPVQLGASVVNALLNGTLLAQYAWHNVVRGAGGAAAGDGVKEKKRA